MLTSRLRKLYATFEHLIHELAKFGVIGAVGFALTVALSNTFHFGANLGPLTSFGLATAIVAVASYFANRHWTWRNKDQTGLRRELPLFLGLSVIGLGLSELPVSFSEYILHLHSALAFNISSTLIGTVIGTIWRFWSFRRYVFKDAEPLRTQEAAQSALV
jgi:putative flippase GtrA